MELVDVNNVTSVSVAALPRYMEARGGSGAMLSPADPVDPWVINMTVGNSGFYLDNITLISTNGVDTSDATPVFVRVSVPCADPDTQGLSVLGLCQCLEAAYIDNGVCKLCEEGSLRCLLRQCFSVLLVLFYCFLEGGARKSGEPQ